MNLSDLNVYDDIVIQCHDNPDADSIGSGYALYKYFQSQGKVVRFIYGGPHRITKSNFLLLLNEFNIPLDYVEELNECELLITVDCQYGAGNVQKFPAKEVAIIDHHQVEVEGIEKTEISSFLASASTLVWDLLREEGFDVNDHTDIATSLYYGLFVDSGEFSEVDHPLDKDMMDSLVVDNGVIRRLKNSVLSLKELEIAGMALIRHSYNNINKFAVIRAHECDPNILGFISDLALQVDNINVCVVYNKTDRGIKFSVRSCVREVMANELAEFLSEKIGGGGGHIVKAGGSISKGQYDRIYGDLNADEYFLSRLSKYYKTFDVFCNEKDQIDKTGMNLYKKKAIPLGFVPLVNVFPVKTPVVIRTLEGDLDILVEQDTYIMIGIEGEVYPTKRDKFENSYKILEGEYKEEFEYFPNIRNRDSGQVIDLKGYASKCIHKGESYIYARPLVKPIKVFTSWDREKYMYGKDVD